MDPNLFPTSPPLLFPPSPSSPIKGSPNYSESFSSFHIENKKPLGKKILEAVLAPIFFLVGVVQSVVFLSFLCIKGLFYKTGIKGYFIDHFILHINNCSKKMQDETRMAINLISDGSIGRQLTIFDENKNRIEAIVIEKEDQGANKSNPSSAALKAIDPKDRKWVVFDFGVRSSNHNCFKSMFEIHKVFDANVISANSAGVGASSGHTLTSDELVMPTESILRHLINTLKVDKKNITLVGHSLGGAKAARVAAKDEFKGVDLILDRSFRKSLGGAAEYTKPAAFPFNFIIKAIANWALPLNTEQAVNKIISQGCKVTAIAAPKDPVVTLPCSASKISNPKVNKIFVRFKLDRGSNINLITKLAGQHTLGHTPEVLDHIWKVHSKPAA